MQRYKEQRDQKQNWGIALLRQIASFIVIIAHFGYLAEDTNEFWTFVIGLRNLAVPVFFCVAFMMSTKYLFNINKEQFIDRMWRLIYPQLAWTFIYYGIYKCIDENVDISYFMWQLFTGHSRLNATMWFQIVLIILTCLFYFIFWQFKRNNALLIISILTIVAIVLQYSELNYIIFEQLCFELKYPLGRIVEMLPYATLGVLLFSCFNHIKFTFFQKIISIALCVSFFCYIDVVQSLLPSINGFGYSGLALMLKTICVIIFFYQIPLEALPRVFLKVLSVSTKYTLGIYCMHRLTEHLLEYFFGQILISISSINKCIIIYGCCWIICFLLDRIPIRAIKRIVN